MSFESNLSAYHTLGTQAEKYLATMSQRLVNASSKEQEKLIEEANQYFKTLEVVYETLGKEMVEIMKPKWWQFWRWG